MNQKSIGDLGENIAFNYLFQKHYQIIARNYRKSGGKLIWWVLILELRTLFF